MGRTASQFNTRIKKNKNVIKKNILQLNNSLPGKLGFFWVTGEELRDRLVHSGVRSTLSLKMVQESLQRNNPDQMHLKTWRYSDVTYFRSTAAHLKPKEKENRLPNEQRFKTGKATGRENRVSINPPQNYFVCCNNAEIRNLLEVTNKALDDLEEAERSKYMSIEIYILISTLFNIISSHIFNTNSQSQINPLTRKR